MTTNERLFTGGLLDEWDAAAKSRDRNSMIEILKRVEFTHDEAASIADRVLANPEKYGF